MGNRLLLADDSITIQKVVAIIFANEEFELTVVDNGTAALEKAREILPDVMLVDALMPGKTGYEVCTEIRRDPRLSSIPILLLIGAFEPLDEEKARSCGADSSISKPFESQQLIDRVKELLELGKTRKTAPAAPPAAEPLPLQAAAEELWGDLSTFDTMPSAAPAAPAAPAAREQAAAAPFAAPAPAPAAPAQPAQSFTTSSFAAPEEPAPAKPAPFEGEIVEASLEDDLWGAFEVEEVSQPATAAPSEVFGVIEPDAEFEAEQFFSFEDESEHIPETGPALDLGYVEEEPVVQPSAEDLFGFEEEPPAPVSKPEPFPPPRTEPVSAPEPEPFAAAEYEPFTLEEFEPEAPAAGASEPIIEPVIEPIPAIEPQGAPVYQPSPGLAERKAEPAPASFSEADLAAAISRISKEVIERIVWEVVPDLAEVLIKEEIRKLREGTRG